jgi:hypothetical protein
MSKPKPAPLPSGTVVGGYQVIKKLAAGGFGVVYLCEDSERHLVALKSTCRRRSPSAAWRTDASRQARKAAAVPARPEELFRGGPPLAQIAHERRLGAELLPRTTVYMVMNYLQGDTLQVSSSRAGPERDKVFREPTIRSLFDEILRGLRIVHQHKMLHLTSSRPTSSSPTRTARCCSTSARRVRCCRRKATSSARCTLAAAPEMYRLTARSVLDRHLRDRRLHLCLHARLPAQRRRSASRKIPARAQPLEAATSIPTT